mgnify:FL=1|jgi:hypothetical protein
MLSEELYNYDAEAWHGVSNATYLATLNAWLIYNDFSLYEDALMILEEQGQYEACHGIKMAIGFIEDVMAHRFGEAEKVTEREDEIVLTHDEHSRVSDLIFKDIMTEIYEKHVNQYKKNN